MTEHGPDLSAEQPLLAGEHLSRIFQSPRRRLFQPRHTIHALNDVSVCVREGESLAVVGESGSGKSTLLKVLLGLDRPNSGSIQFQGRDIVANPNDRMLWLRRHTGVVFQDPFTSLNPRMRVGDIVAEPLVALNMAGNRELRVRSILDRVELPADSIDRYPHEFSGGQRQRIALARAIVHTPRLLVGDEPLSALDVLVREKIVALLKELQVELNLTLLTVTHDLGVVPSLAHRVAVMRAGEIVETGLVSKVLTSPQHEYTQELVNAVPRLSD